MGCLVCCVRVARMLCVVGFSMSECGCVFHSAHFQLSGAAQSACVRTALFFPFAGWENAPGVTAQKSVDFLVRWSRSLCSAQRRRAAAFFLEWTSCECTVLPNP